MPTLQKLADNGLMYSQWHTTALCSPTRSTLPDRAQPPSERHGLHHRGLDRLPGRERPHSARVRHAGRGDAPEPDRARSGWARTTMCRSTTWPRRHEGDVAAPSGLGPLLRLPGRRDEQLVSGSRQRQPLHRSAVFARGGLSPLKGSGRSGDPYDPRRQGERAVTAMVHLVLPGRQPRAASCAAGVHRQVQGQVRRRLRGLP